MKLDVSVSENRESFLARLSQLSPHQLKLVDFAYDLAKEAHRTQRRDSGERFFEHPRSAALILIVECGMQELGLIIPCLIHDTVEDTPIFGNINRPHSERMATAKWRIGHIFGTNIANTVIALTKPSVDGVDLLTKQDAHKAYISNLWLSSPDAVLVKMADRLHNLRSLAGNTAAKQKKTVIETRKVYWPLFTTVVLPAYPQVGQYLLDQMELEMARYTN